MAQEASLARSADAPPADLADLSRFVHHDGPRPWEETIGSIEAVLGMDLAREHVEGMECSASISSCSARQTAAASGDSMVQEDSSVMLADKLAHFVRQSGHAHCVSMR